MKDRLKFIEINAKATTKTTVRIVTPSINLRDLNKVHAHTEQTKTNAD